MKPPITEGERISELLVADFDPQSRIVGKTAVMWKVYKIIEKVSANIHPVLIQGESGTGKELVARAIHFHGSRHERPFIPVDCGALVPTLLESDSSAMKRERSQGRRGQRKDCCESRKAVPFF